MYHLVSYWRRKWQPNMYDIYHSKYTGFPGVSVGKESACNARDLGLSRYICTPGEGNGNPLQCSCLENPRDGGAWWAAVYGVAQSQTRLK